MKKITFLLFLYIVCAGAVFAQHLTVTNTSGKKESYSLQEVRRIVFREGEIRLASPEDRLVKAFPYENVTYFNFDAFPTDLVPAWADENANECSVAYYNNTRSLFISMTPKPEWSAYTTKTVRISTSDGMLVKLSRFEDTTFSVNISDLISGTYVVNLTCNKFTTSFKFVK